jgi:phosphate transport system permease protein
VLLIINASFQLNWHVVQSGGYSVASMIAGQWQYASGNQLSALMAAGLVLFTITLIVNSLASIIINRSRSGAATAD